MPYNNNTSIITILNMVQDIIYFLEAFYKINKNVDENIQVKRTISELNGFLNDLTKNIAAELENNSNNDKIVKVNYGISKYAVGARDRLKAIESSSENPNIPSLIADIDNVLIFFKNLENSSLFIKNDELRILKAKIIEIL